MSKDIAQKSHTPYILASIGLMTVGQLPAGIYLPAMAKMAMFFSVTQGKVQNILSLYLLSYGLSQLCYGPISDKYGRKFSAMAGLFIFMIGCIVTILSHHIATIYIGSIIQGIGLGSVAVVSTALLKDLYSSSLLQSTSYKSAATIITPLLAPILGSYLFIHFSWQSTFGFLLCYSLLSSILVYYLFKETNQNRDQSVFTLKNILKNYLQVVKTPSFSWYAIARILAVSGGTAYAVNSPFLFIKLLHLSPISYAWISVMPASGFFIGSMLCKFMSKQYRVNQIIFIASLILFISSIFFLLVTIAFPISILGIIIPMFFYMIGNGMMYPSSMTAAILPIATLSGTAVALIGSVQNLGRGMVSALVNQLHSYGAISLSMTLAMLTAVCLMIVVFISSKEKKLITTVIKS